MTTDSKAPPPPRIPGYEIKGELGRGGMGIVYLAKRQQYGNLVALKVLQVDEEFYREDLRRFRREAKALAKLSHPNLVALVDHELEMQPPFLVFEYVEQARLLDELYGTKPQVARIYDLAKGIAAGLGHIHANGLVHRDLKPGNVLVDPQGRARIIDLGLVRSVKGDDSAITAMGHTVGSLPYMAPEQLVGDKVDARADVYAVGLIMYELLADKVLFGTEEPLITPQQRLLGKMPELGLVATEVPAPLHDLVSRCVNLDRTKRPADGNALLADLHAAQGGSVSKMKRPERASQAAGKGEARAASRLKTLVAGVALAVLLALILLLSR